VESLVLHTTRGTLESGNLNDSRLLHNSFVAEGPQPGREIARALSDLSHNIYAPAERVGDTPGVESGELLFIDYWADPNGMETFFANVAAQEAGDRLFSAREESEWAPALNAFTFQVPAPVDAPARFIGMMRAPVNSAADAITALGKLVSTNLAAARRRGQLSHGLFVRVADTITIRPASNARRSGGEDVVVSAQPVEILAVDSWSTLEGLEEHYGDAVAMAGLDNALAGPPTTSVWEQVGGFAEW